MNDIIESIQQDILDRNVSLSVRQATRYAEKVRTKSKRGWPIPKDAGLG